MLINIIYKLLIYYNIEVEPLTKIQNNGIYFNDIEIPRSNIRGDRYIIYMFCDHGINFQKDTDSLKSAKHKT